jgi:hypothetical protein
MSGRCVRKNFGATRNINKNITILGHNRTEGMGVTTEHHNQVNHVSELNKLDLNKERDKPQLLKVKKLHPKEYIDWC